MPPRYVYWTILIDGKATAFRARDKEELLPTLKQLSRANERIELKFFARGKLWDSPEQADWAASSLPPARERRTKDWRPGGSHRDPRQRFDGPTKKPVTAAAQRERDAQEAGPETTDAAPDAGQTDNAARERRSWKHPESRDAKAPQWTPRQPPQLEDGSEPEPPVDDTRGRGRAGDGRPGDRGDRPKWSERHATDDGRDRQRGTGNNDRGAKTFDRGKREGGRPPWNRPAAGADAKTAWNRPAPRTGDRSKWNRPTPSPDDRAPRRDDREERPKWTGGKGARDGGGDWKRDAGSGARRDRPTWTGGKGARDGDSDWKRDAGGDVRRDRPKWTGGEGARDGGDWKKDAGSDARSDRPKWTGGKGARDGDRGWKKDAAGGDRGSRTFDRDDSKGKRPAWKRPPAGTDAKPAWNRPATRDEDRSTRSRSAPGPDDRSPRSDDRGARPKWSGGKGARDGARDWKRDDGRRDSGERPNWTSGKRPPEGGRDGKRDSGDRDRGARTFNRDDGKSERPKWSGRERRDERPARDGGFTKGGASGVRPKDRPPSRPSDRPKPRKPR